MPKPLLIALTGGYRRIPVLQIGRDIFCDSRLIIDEIERRFPLPSIFDGIGAGLGHALTWWSDRVLFLPVVGLAFGSGDWDADEAFIADRSKLRGIPFDIDAMKRDLPQSAVAFREQCGLVERQLEGGRRFLLGNQPNIVDASVYITFAMIHFGKGLIIPLLDEFPRVREWAKRVRAIGHGFEEKITAQEAVDLAQQAGKEINNATDGREERLIQFTFGEPGGATLEGQLISEDYDRISIQPEAAHQSHLHIHLLRSAGILRA